MQEKITQSFPTLAVAWEPLRQLRVGASFGWGITTFDFTTGSYSRVIATRMPLLVGGLSDVSTKVTGTDGFVPRVQVGLWTQPVSTIPLELGASFTWTQAVSSASSKLELANLNTTYYPANIIALIGPLAQPNLNATVRNVTLTVPQVSTLNTGLRYAKKLQKPVGKGGDRLASERFDVEANLVVSFGKTVDRIVVGLPPTSITVPSPSPGLAPDTQLTLPTRIALEHHWQTQYGLRIGGDYNVLPGLLALRLGYSYESDGVSPGYHQLDFTPFRRFGLYGGATVRILDWVDVSASYSFFVVPDVTNTAANAGIRRNVSGEPSAGDDAISNAGRFTQTASAVVLGVGGHL